MNVKDLALALAEVLQRKAPARVLIHLMLTDVLKRLVRLADSHTRHTRSYPDPAAGMWRT